MNVLFDLDGTLTDPREGILACLRYAFEKMGCACPEDRALEACIGPPLQRSLPVLLGANAHRANEALALYRERFEAKGLYENAVYPGIREALARLKAHGMRLHVATSKPHVFARRILEHFELAGLFDSVHGSELDGRRTDKKALIAHLLVRESVLPKAAVMVGDRGEDMLGANANGVAGIGALWGYGSRDELGRAGARHLCAQPLALPRMIGAQ